MRPKEIFHIPNCIDPSALGLAPKRQELVAQWGLGGSKVVMTAGRMDGDAMELRKGFDEVLEVLPALLREIPNLMYMIVGDGSERANLEAKARQLGVHERVRFTGYIAESEKADYYRLADVFAMPGSNPGFDTYPFRFVFLEALACGIPVVAAQALPGERDDAAVKALLVQVDPTKPGSIAEGIRSALAKRPDQPTINPVLKKFYYSEFEARTHLMLSTLLARSDS
jgi:glycosyltransferase involved in cell wall biosynthesis